MLFFYWLSGLFFLEFLSDFRQSLPIRRNHCLWGCFVCFLQFVGFFDFLRSSITRWGTVTYFFNIEIELTKTIRLLLSALFLALYIYWISCFKTSEKCNLAKVKLGYFLLVFFEWQLRFIFISPAFFCELPGEAVQKSH